MRYVKLFLKLIPFVIELIRSVEKWFESESGMGEQKKSAVMSALYSILEGWGAAATGGAAATWAKLNPVLSKCIDFVVDIFFNWDKD